MLLHPKNLKTHVAASNRGRYALDTIALTKKGSVSSDGRLVLFIPYPDSKPADAPSIPGVNAMSPTPDLPVLVRTADAARAAAMVGKGKRVYGSPLTDLIQAEIKGDKIAFGATDLSAPQTMIVGRDEGAWPNIGSFLPDMSKATVITLDLDNMLKALKTLRAASNDQEVTVRVLSDEHGVSFSTRDGVALYLMPVSVKTPEDHCGDNLVAFKDTPNQPEAVPPAPAEAAETPKTAETTTPDTSIGSADDTADLPDEDSDNDSDDFAYDESYQDDGPAVESEMESDANEVHANAEAAFHDAAKPSAVATDVARPEVATVAVAAPVAVPTPEVPVPVSTIPAPIAGQPEPVAVGV